MKCRHVTEEASYKALALKAFAEARDWNAEARQITHRDYPDKRSRQAGWTVIARRGPEVVTATWIDKVAIGPIGWQSGQSAQRPTSQWLPWNGPSRPR